MKKIAYGKAFDDAYGFAMEKLADEDAPLYTQEQVEHAKERALQRFHDRLGSYDEGIHGAIKTKRNLSALGAGAGLIGTGLLGRAAMKAKSPAAKAALAIGSLATGAGTVAAGANALWNQGIASAYARPDSAVRKKLNFLNMRAGGALDPNRIAVDLKKDMGEG